MPYNYLRYKTLMNVKVFLLFLIFIKCSSVDPKTEVLITFEVNYLSVNSYLLEDKIQQILREENWEFTSRHVIVNVTNKTNNSICTGIFYKDHGTVDLTSSWFDLPTERQLTILKHGFGHALMNLSHSSDPNSYMYTGVNDGK